MKGLFSGAWAALGSLSGGKRKDTTDDVQHVSPAKRSRQNSPCKAAEENIGVIEQHLGQPAPAPKPALAPVTAQQQEQLPKPFQHMMRQPEATKTFERRRKEPVQNAFKQFGSAAQPPLSQLPSSASKPRSKQMKYFAGKALQQHGSSPVIGWTSGTPQQHLRSQPRPQAYGNSSRYKVNHQGGQWQFQQAAKQAGTGAAAYVFGPEVAATPVAATPEIKQRLFQDAATGAAAGAVGRFMVANGPLAATAANAGQAGAAPADAGPANGHDRYTSSMFTAALGQEASGLGLGLKHSPAALAGAAAGAANGTAAPASSNPLLFASFTAQNPAADEERILRELAALQQKLQKKQQNSQTFASTYRETLARPISKALALSPDYEVSSAAGIGMQQLQLQAAQKEQQRLEQEAVRLQQQQQRRPTASQLLQQLQQKPFPSAGKLQQQRLRAAQQQQQEEEEEQQEQSSDVVCIDDDDEDVDGVESQQIEESEEEEELASSVGSEYEASEEEFAASIAAGQLQQLHLEWEGPRSNWTPTDEEYERFESATLQAGNLQEVLAQHHRSNIELTRAHFEKLCRTEWLNDEIINMYVAMLLDRDKAMRDHPELEAPKCHFFNTFFLNKLYKDAMEQQHKEAEEAYNYNNVRRWTTAKKLAVAGQASDSVLKLDRIILPVHEGAHWTAAMIDLVNKRFVFFDSLGGRNLKAIAALKRWLADEAKDKLKEDWDCQSWPEMYPRNIPRQLNGCDCGVFSLLFCNRLGAGMAFDFAQADLEINARVKVACELLDGKLPLPQR